MTILLTGVAGFIGFHTAQALLDQGEPVIGLDNLNDYYDVNLKKNRLAKLEGRNGFAFEKLDVSDKDAIFDLFDRRPEIDRIIHLAAQAGVRYSLVNPFAYLRANIDGHVVLLEACRKLASLKHFVYASSSSIYGANTDLPFAVGDPVDRPVSLYGATKKAMEEISHAYAHIYRFPLTGLRFFTVYGPWGRPDMALFIFTQKIMTGETIEVFNYGDMRRDFTFIDDIVAGVNAVLRHPPAENDADVPARVYNLGNHRSESLMDYVRTIEKALGKTANIEYLPMQTGDVKETYADIESSRRDFGFEPKTTIETGIPRFVAWFREYYNV